MIEFTPLLKDTTYLLEKFKYTAQEAGQVCYLPSPRGLCEYFYHHQKNRVHSLVLLTNPRRSNFVHLGKEVLVENMQLLVTKYLPVTAQRIWNYSTRSAQIKEYNDELFLLPDNVPVKEMDLVLCQGHLVNGSLKTNLFPKFPSGFRYHYFKARYSQKGASEEWRLSEAWKFPYNSTLPQSEFLSLAKLEELGLPLKPSFNFPAEVQKYLQVAA